MKLKLKDIQKNPYRDFDIDPINEEAVNALRRSIADHDFWNGLLVRKSEGEYQLVFGHHRLEAAKRAGIEELNIPVVRWTDDQMIRGMAAENATQRHTNFSASANDVAAAMRVLGHVMLINEECPEKLSKFFESLPMGWGVAKGMFLKGSGLGEGLLFRYFDEQLPKGVLREVVAQMKASGKMEEITDEVIDKAVTAGHKFDLPKIEHTEKTFNMAVGQILTNPSHLQAFRNVMKTDIAQKAVSVANQVEFAKSVVETIGAKKRKTGRQQLLTAAEVHTTSRNAVRAHFNLSTDVRKKAIAKDDAYKAQHEWAFARNKMAHSLGHLHRLKELLEKGIKPAGFNPLEAQSFFKTEAKTYKALIDEINALFSIYYIDQREVQYNDFT